MEKHCPFKLIIWYPGYTIAKSYFSAYVLNILCHFVPGLLLDLVMIITNNKKRLNWHLIFIEIIFINLMLFIYFVIESCLYLERLNILCQK